MLGYCIHMLSFFAPLFCLLACCWSSHCVSGHFRLRQCCYDKHLMGLETLHSKKTAFLASRYNVRSQMEINMTAALTKSIFSFSLHHFLSSYRVSAYRHYEDVLVFSYGEYNCLQALAPCSAKITGNVAHRDAPHRRVSKVFFSFYVEATRWRRWCPLSPDTIDLWLLMCRHGRPRGSPLLRYIMLVTMWLSSRVLSM